VCEHELVTQLTALFLVYLFSTFFFIFMWDFFSVLMEEQSVISS